MSEDLANSGRESEWVWGTRVTAEAARIALSSGGSPRDRFEMYERLVVAAFEGRGSGNGKVAEISTDPGLSPAGKALYGYIESAIQNLSGFEETGGK